MDYVKMRKMAEKLVRKFGVPAGMTYTDLNGNVSNGFVVYVKPDRKRQDAQLEKEYITDSNQQGAYFHLTDGVAKVENGGIITSSGVSHVVKELKPFAPSDYVIIYNCLLET